VSERPPPNDLGATLRTLWRHKLVVLACVAVAAGAAAVQASDAPKSYEAAAVVLVPLQDPTSTGSGNSAGNPAAVPTTVELLKNPTLMAAAVDKLGGPSRAPSFVLGDVAAVPDSQLVRVPVQAGRPRLAVIAANAYAQAFVDKQRQNTETVATARAKVLGDQASALAPQLTDLQQQISTEQDKINAQQLAYLRTRDSSTVAPLPNTALLDSLKARYDQISQSQQNFQTQASQYQVVAGFNGGASLAVQASEADSVTPSPLRRGLLAGVIGLVLGVALAFALEALRPRRRHRGRTAAPVDDDVHAGPPLPAAGGGTEVAAPARTADGSGRRVPDVPVQWPVPAGDPVRAD